MKTTTKGMDITLWVFSGLLAALFMIAGIAKFFGAMNDEFRGWGYTLEFATIVGIIEVLAGIGLLFKRAAGWSALALMVIMLGAIWTHATHAEYAMLALPIVVFLLLGFVAWGRGLAWESRRPPEVSGATSTPQRT